MILKWPGGKLRVLPDLLEHIPNKYGVYFEPFFGSGALFFNLKPHKSVINDINKPLIELYEVVKANPKTLISRLKSIEKDYLKLSEQEKKDYYYARREEYNKLKSGIRKSVLLIFLNKTCFNGMYRENSKGEFNVPMGSYKNPKILFEDRIIEASERLKEAKLSSSSFESSLESAKRGDFVYLDPPYHPVSKTSNFTAYSKDDFSKEDQEKLADMYKNLDKKGCYVMLSNSDTPLINELYKGYNIHRIQVGRAINSKANGRGKIKEVIVTNY